MEKTTPNAINYEAKLNTDMKQYNRVRRYGLNKASS